MHIFKDTHYDFLRWRWYAIGLSTLVVVAGMVTIATKGINKGVEFAGGTVVIESSSSRCRSSRCGRRWSHLPRREHPDLRRSVAPAVHDPRARGRRRIGRLARAKADAIEARFKQSNIGAFKREATEIVGPAVGAELTNRGIWATVLSLVGILAISFRFQLSFAVGAVVATVHDLLVTFAFIAFFGYDLTLNVIAALLTITGFSTNDTIVIFDRVRENLRLCGAIPGPRINVAINRRWAARSSLRHGAAVGAGALLLRR